MIALRLVHLIEKHSEELTQGLLWKIEASARTADLRKVPTEEFRGRIHEILRHLSEWLLTKTGGDIEKRYFEIGERRAAQGVALSDFCWGIVLTKEHLWEFLQSQGFMRGPVEIYGELELLRLLDQFFDRALCFATEGYEQYVRLQNANQAQVVDEHRLAQWRARGEACAAGTTSPQCCSAGCPLVSESAENTRPARISSLASVSVSP